MFVGNWRSEIDIDAAHRALEITEGVGGMSPTKKDRNFRSIYGIQVPEAGAPLTGAQLAIVIAAALRREFGDTHAATKLVAGFSNANQRAAKNWLSAKNGPSGPYLIEMMRFSDEVLETVLVLSNRETVLLSKKVIDARDKLLELLEQIDELISNAAGKS
jgi:hypothetical protein